MGQTKSVVDGFGTKAILLRAAFPLSFRCRCNTVFPPPFTTVLLQCGAARDSPSCPG